MDLYPFVVFLHVVGAFAFALGHGSSVAVAFKLRRERDPSRVAALLELSELSIYGVYAGLAVLLLAGIAAGFLGGWWGRLWIWVSLGLLLALILAMAVLGTMFYTKVRHAVGIKGYMDKKDAPVPEPSPEELAALLQSPRPFVLAAVGGGSLLVLLWLMYFKPF